MSSHITGGLTHTATYVIALVRLNSLKLFLLVVAPCGLRGSK